MSKVYNITGGGGGTGGGIVRSLSILEPPRKTKYFPGETFDRTDMVVRAAYNTGVFRDVTNYTVVPETLTANVMYVTIHYTEGGREVTAVQAIEMLSPLTGITIVSNPVKVSYVYGEAFEPAGMAVRADYLDGTSRMVNKYSCDTGVLNTIGAVPVTISYSEEGRTATAVVSVLVSKAADALVADQDNLYLDATWSTKTIYLTHTGTGEITASSSNTAVASVSVNGNTVTVYGLSTGSASIYITSASDLHYQGESLVIPVEVSVNPSISEIKDKTAALSTWRNRYATATLNDYAFIISGLSSDDAQVNYVDRFDEELTRTYFSCPAYNYLAGSQAVTYNGKIYVFTLSPENGKNTILSMTAYYTMDENGTWAQKTMPSTYTKNGQATVFAGHIWLASGGLSRMSCPDGAVTHTYCGKLMVMGPSETWATYDSNTHYGSAVARCGNRMVYFPGTYPEKSSSSSEVNTGTIWKATLYSVYMRGSPLRIYSEDFSYTTLEYMDLTYYGTLSSYIRMYLGDASVSYVAWTDSFTSSREVGAVGTSTRWTQRSRWTDPSAWGLDGNDFCVFYCCGEGWSDSQVHTPDVEAGDPVKITPDGVTSAANFGNFQYPATPIVLPNQSIPQYIVTLSYASGYNITAHATYSEYSNGTASKATNAGYLVYSDASSMWHARKRGYYNFSYVGYYAFCIGGNNLCTIITMNASQSPTQGKYALQDKTVTPTTSQQVITKDSSFYGLNKVTVNAIPTKYQDVSQAHLTAEALLKGNTAVTTEGVIVGTMPHNGTLALVLNDMSHRHLDLPEGYISGGTVDLVEDLDAAIQAEIETKTTAIIEQANEDVAAARRERDEGIAAAETAAEEAIAAAEAAAEEAILAAEQSAQAALDQAVAELWSRYY